MGSAIFVIAIGLVLLCLLMLWFFASRYIKVPKGKVLVVYGKTESNQAETYAGGATFVWPVIQAYKFLDLIPFEKKLDQEFSTRDNVSIPVISTINFGISNHPDCINNAAERLLGLENDHVENIGLSIINHKIQIIFKELDLVSLAMNKNKPFLKIIDDLNEELNKAGMSLYSFNIEFPKDLNTHLYELEQKFKEKKANSFEIGDHEEDEKQLEILNQKIIANAEDREALIEEKLNLLVKFKNLR